MTARHQLWTWSVAASAALLFLVGIMSWERHEQSDRWNSFLGGNPAEGAHTFESKGCTDCHALCGTGTKDFPDLGLQHSREVDVNGLAIRLWNHMPAMAAKWKAKGKGFPRISREQMADLFSYLYSACYVAGQGQAEKGKLLFTQRSCVRCHRIGAGQGGSVGPNLKEIGPVTTPIYWSQTMWNHAAAMESHIRQLNLSWPRFEGTEMDDLLTYLQEERAGPQREFELLPADADNGWKIFKEKGCIACHAIRGQGGGVGPELGATGTTPRTITQLAGKMWNHSPEMWKQMQARKIERPTFQGTEMADLVAFLYSLRWFDQSGSPAVGKDLFHQRKCAACHGAEGEGTEKGPTLRKRGQNLTPVFLAQRFWLHGPVMLETYKQQGLAWPILEDADLEHLLAFLNTPRNTGKVRGRSENAGEGRGER